jgi:hypothetical protein
LPTLATTWRSNFLRECRRRVLREHVVFLFDDADPLASRRMMMMMMVVVVVGGV